VAASRCLVRRVSGTRLLLSLAWVCAAGYVVVARDPRVFEDTLAGVTAVVVALALTTWSLRRRNARLTTAVVATSTVGVLVLQMAQDPTPAAPDRNMPAARTAYAGRLPSAEGDVMVLGNAETMVARDPAIAEELLIGSAWYLGDKDVQNGYTTINFRRFRDRFCRVYNGGTCAAALPAVRSTEPTTGRPWVDLLSVSTLALFRPSFPEDDLTDPPPGWSLSQVTSWVVVWTRDEPVPTAGGVVWTSAGTSVDEASRTDRSLSLRVRAVGPEGGTVTLSRLAWPGYAVEGGALLAPLDGMLVRVSVPAGSAGSTVTIRWEPPGWRVELAALWSAVLLGLVWVLLRWRSDARRARAAGGIGRPRAPAG
jgi:hypothetical protein